MEQLINTFDWSLIPAVITLIAIWFMAGTKPDEKLIDKNFKEMAYWFELICWFLVISVSWNFWAFLKLLNVIS